MDILLDGWSILLDHWIGIAVLCVTIWGLGRYAFQRLFDSHQFRFIQEILMTLNLGTLVLAWFCFIVVLLGQFSQRALTVGSFIIPVAALASWLWALAKRHSFSSGRWFMLIVFCLILFTLLVVRLAFGRELILPPYDDSPEHYSMIRDLLDGPENSSASFYSLGRITERYYHFGFHAIAAWLTSVTGTDAAQVMIWLGQALMVFPSLSVFLLALAITENVPAALVTAVFSGFAWRMPAFAANWGKYPAITGLALFPGWLGLLILYRKSTRSRFMDWFLPALILLGLGLIHTRLFICLILLGVSAFLSAKLPARMFNTKAGFFLFSGLAVLSIFIFIKPITIYYSTGWLLPFGTSVILIPYAVRAFPRTMACLSLTLLGVWAASTLPVFFEGYGPNWLDAPFVELLLFIPFALFAGLGFAGLLHSFPHLPAFSRALLISLPLLAALVGFASSETFKPDPCCNYVSEADMSALRWIDENSDENAVIWIAGVKSRNYLLGTDGGIWVSTLTGRNMNKLRYDFAWPSDVVPGRLCQAGYEDVYIYEGGQPYSFDGIGLSTAIWLEQAFTEEDVTVYRFDCP
jgi:hypothetical protein